MQPYNTIVVGLGAAGVTAATTLAKAGRRVLGLEAQARVGGRVHTVPFGNGLVELGAEWIHGEEKNCVYELVSKYNVITTIQLGTMRSFRSNGDEVDNELVDELLKFTEDCFHHPPSEPEPMGVYATKKVTEYIKANKPYLLNDQDFITEFLEFNHLLTNNYESSNDWDDVSTVSRYQEPVGEHLISLHGYGYKTFFEIMMNTYNNGPGLPNLDLKMSTEVTQIRTPQSPADKVVVQCKNGSSYEADNVIVTVSLGVLKDNYTTLFSPPLPKDKQTAIEKISIGVVDKIILSFDNPWWPHDVSYFGFIWKGEDKKKVGPADYWTTRIFGASRPMGAGNCLTMWTGGDVAKEVETLPEDIVKVKCVELLQRFVSDNMNVAVPQPNAITRSTWYSNPYTRGSYSFDNIETPQYLNARAWLGAPITDSAGAPRVLFAGEATHLAYFSTVHGASETGYREALRILNSGKAASE